jgi:hypothetical protein
VLCSIVDSFVKGETIEKPPTTTPDAIVVITKERTMGVLCAVFVDMRCGHGGERRERPWPQSRMPPSDDILEIPVGQQLGYESVFKFKDEKKSQAFCAKHNPSWGINNVAMEVEPAAAAAAPVPDLTLVTTEESDGEESDDEEEEEETDVPADDAEYNMAVTRLEIHTHHYDVGTFRRAESRAATGTSKVRTLGYHCSLVGNWLEVWYLVGGIWLEVILEWRWWRLCIEGK